MTIYINAKDLVVSEKDGFAEFTITLSAPSQEQISVYYGTYSDSATSLDFGNVSDTLVFAPGVTSQKVRVQIKEDALAEKMESFYLSLNNAKNAVIASPVVQVLVVDNDANADSTHKAGLSVRDTVVDAASGAVTFTLVLDKATSDGFSVAYSTLDVTAKAGSDYTAASGSVSFGAGETAKTVTVPLLAGSGVEGAELFNLVLGNVTGSAAGSVAVTDGIGHAMIGASGQTPVATPVISIGNPTVGEKDGYVEFVVSLNAPSRDEVSVYANMYNGTAVSNDYGGTGLDIVFAPGVTVRTVRIPITDDTVTEKAESFFLSLSNPRGGVVAAPYGTATIVDNDSTADSGHKAYLSVRDVTVDAARDVATFYVVLDKATADSFSVAYNTANGTATAGSDYLAASGSLTFAAGETVKAVTVALPHDDVAEPAEMFNLVLGAVSGNAAGAVAVADGVGQALIGSHGQTPVATPVINVSAPIVGEGDPYVDFLVTLSSPAQERVSVSYNWFNATAVSNDFVGNSGSVTFAPGETTQFVRIPVVDDGTAEKTEAFYVNLNSPINAVLGNQIAVATIFDNDTYADSANKARLSVRDVVVDASSDTATFAVVLDKATLDSFSVAYNTANGSATAGSDYVAASGALSFGPGETVKTVTVALPHDGAAELAETFNLVLGAIGGAGAGTVAIGDGTGQATIGSHGQTPVASPSVSIANASANEKEGYMDFLVTLSAPSRERISVFYDGYNGSATSNDYVSLNSFLTFAPGETTRVIRVPIFHDNVDEALETFTVRLLNATNAVVSNGIGTGSIVDSNAVPAAVQVTGTAGLDTVNVDGPRANFTVTKTAQGFTVTDNSGAAAAQMLSGVERIHFSDVNVALDIDGTGGQAYRIYQAAFNRTPDAAGLGFWMNAMDKGTSLNDVAAGFMKSEEFIKAYGANPSSHDLVSQIYMNVLHRPAEAAGLDYWVKALDAHQVTAAGALSLISESAENQAALAPVIGNGFPYQPFG